jgi:hypothetical protein
MPFHFITPVAGVLLRVLQALPSVTASTTASTATSAGNNFKHTVLHTLHTIKNQLLNCSPK